MNRYQYSFFSLKPLWFAGLFLLLCAYSPPHKYYLSNTEIRIDTLKKTMSISCRVFSDDLEEALKKKQSKKPDLLKSTSDVALQVRLYDYVNDRLLLVAG